MCLFWKKNELFWECFPRGYLKIFWDILTGVDALFNNIIADLETLTGERFII